jgi:hypothetical protein
VAEALAASVYPVAVFDTTWPLVGLPVEEMIHVHS